MVGIVAEQDIRPRDCFPPLKSILICSAADLHALSEPASQSDSSNNRPSVESRVCRSWYRPLPRSLVNLRIILKQLTVFRAFLHS